MRVWSKHACFWDSERLTEVHCACELGHGTAGRDLQATLFHNDEGQRAFWRPVLFCEGLALFFQMSAAPPLASSKTPSNCCRCQRDNSSGVLFCLIRRLFLDASCASTGLYPKNVCSIDAASA